MNNYFLKKKKFFQKTTRSKLPNYHKFFKKKKVFFYKAIKFDRYIYFAKKINLSNGYIILENNCGFRQVHVFSTICNLFYPYMMTNIYHNFLKINSLWLLFSFTKKGELGYNIKINNTVFYAKSYKSQFKVNSLAKNTITIQLPSQQILVFPKFQLTGYQSNILRKSKKIKIKVRGIAKNPVDHPNGGRTNVKNPLRTPWGFIAKSSK